MADKVVFFGNEKLATGIDEPEPVIKKAVEQAGFEIEKVVTGPLSDLGKHEAKLAVLAAYGRIIPQGVLDEFPLGIINVHPSLLPILRGPTPIETAILEGLPKTGVSIMRLSAAMDEGPIYKQKTIHLNGTESKAKLAKHLQQLGADLIKEVLPKIYDGSLMPRQQPHPTRATYSHLIKKEDGVIDWNKPAQAIEREIRAYSGWPNSRTSLAGKDVIITAAHSVPTNTPGAKPGHLEVVKDAGLIMVDTSNGSLCIERLKPTGKKEMSTAEFIRGYMS